MTKQVGNPRTKSSFDADLELNPFVPKNESINTFHPPQRKASLHYQTNSTDSTSFPNYNFRSGDRNFRTKEGSIISSKYGSPARKESNLGTSIRTQDPADISTSSNMLPTIAQTSPIELDLEKSLQGNQNQSKEVKKDHQQKEQPQPVRTDRSNSAPEETSFYNEIASDIAEILHNFGSKHTTTFEESERRISSIDVSKIIQRNSSILKTISEVSTKSNKSTLDSRDFSIVENKLKNLMGGIMPPTSSSKQQILSIVSAKSGFTGSSQPSAEINEKDVFTFERALPDFSRIISVLEKIDHWNWDIFELNDFANGWPLFTLSNFLFTKSELFVKFKISRRHFLKFVNLVERGYKDIPYHNSIHATDVLHGVNWLKDRCSILICPSDMETMAIYFAAIIHDYEYFYLILAIPV